MGPPSIAYVSASTNRHSYAASVSAESLVALGCGRSVALWDVADEVDRGIARTLPGHEGLVTAIRFLSGDSFVSADDKGAIRYHVKENNLWIARYSLTAHEKPISSLAVHGTLIVSAASDSQVKVWQFGTEELHLVDTLYLEGWYPLSIDLTNPPNSNAQLLAIGTTDRAIQIWICSEGKFVKVAVLSGHEDWVRCLSFCPPNLGSDDLILASGSQDGSIRLWKIEPRMRFTPGGKEGHTDDLLDAFEASLGDLEDAEEGGRQISLKRHVVTVKVSDGSSQQFTIAFDALLIGHEAGITSLAWRPSSSDYLDKPPTLLSTSTDSSVILWSPSSVINASPDNTTSIWINRQRFGDVGGQRLGGFVGGLWARQGLEVLAWGWSGGWRRWRQQSAPTSDQHLEKWKEIGAVTGHSGPVKGLSWSHGGEFLISVGTDQTTRIHGAIPDAHSVSSWHEIGRPQVHGYDLVDVAFLAATRFISIADEKVARVFEAPQEFVELATNIHVASFSTGGNDRPRAATVSPLGLSNKATDSAAQSDPDSGYDLARSQRRPFEGELAAITLWPEVEKVFGHGYESIALAASHDGSLVATACKATTAEHAVVRVYNTKTWQLFGSPLAGHALTVTRIAFSPDGKFVLSVSRDRCWRLFERDHSDGGYHLVSGEKPHARIIWDCDWAREGDIFATASRDKTVKIWSADPNNTKKWLARATIKLDDAATAVAFAAEDQDNRRRLAIGLENGGIVIFSGSRSDLASWEEELKLDSRIAHTGQIHRLAWRPGPSQASKQLASCSEDGTLKVLLVHIGTT